MPLVNFRKKFRLVPSIFARISKFEHLRGVTEHTWNQIFF
jgi:hypothetical protein